MFSFLLSQTGYFLNVSLARRYCFYIEEKHNFKNIIWELPPLVWKRKSLEGVGLTMLRWAWVRWLRVGA